MAYNQRRRPPSPRRNGDGMYRFGGNNDRNDDARNNFNFRSQGNSGPSFPPTGPRRDREGGGRRFDKNDRSGRGGRRQNNRGGGWRKPGASERAILFSKREPTPERLAGMNSGDISFRMVESGESDGEDDVVALDDTEPSKPVNEVDVSDDDSEEEDHPRAKRAKTAVTTTEEAEADTKPKWSNPDPYTALPPPGESSLPRTNVLDMIRKAKVQNDGAAEQAAKADEFISLNFDDDQQDDAEDVISISSDEEYVPDAGRQNGMSIKGNAQGRGDSYVPQRDQGFSIRGEADRGRYDRGRSRSPPRREYGWSRYSRSPEDPRDRYSPPPPPRDGYSRYSNYPPPQSYDRYDDRYDGRYNDRDRDRYEDRDRYRSGGYSNAPDYGDPHPRMNPPPPPSHAQDDYAPPPPPPAPRTLDQWPPPAPIPAPQAPQDRKRKRAFERDLPGVTSEWYPRGNASDTPWMSYCDPKEPPESWLHNEVENFYYYASPRASERQLRQDLIDRVQEGFSVIGQHKHEVIAFGSSATHLYLPTGDVDLVILSDYYRRTRYPQIATNRSAMNRMVRNIISGKRLGHSPLCIPKAKVPLIKYFDGKTGLPVDISFENDSGLAAIETLNRWLSEYPALNRLVFPLKQFLKMRGLNEVNGGGLGGFSTICLVAFRLHNLAVEHGDGWAMKHLDLALIDLFEYFGKFDLNAHGLDMVSMTVIDKTSWAGPRPSQPGRLLIVDPNNPDNDISGGSGKVSTIFRLFESAAASLKQELERMRSMRGSKTPRWSMLNSILGANYSTYDTQRRRLENLSREMQRDMVPAQEPIDLTGSDDEYEPADVGGTRDSDMTATTTPQEMSASTFKQSYIQQHHDSASKAAPAKKAPKRKAEDRQAKPVKKNKTTKKAPTAVQNTAPPTSAPKEPKKQTRKERRMDMANKAAQRNKDAREAENKLPTQPKAKKATKADRKTRMADEQRATTFKQTYPGVPCPAQLNKSKFKELVKKQPAPASA